MRGLATSIGSRVQSAMGLGGSGGRTATQTKGASVGSTYTHDAVGKALVLVEPIDIGDGLTVDVLTFITEDELKKHWRRVERPSEQAPNP